MHFAQCLTNATCGFEHIGRGLQVQLAPGGTVLMFAQQRDHGLGDGEIAGALQHHDALARALEHGSLAEAVDLVDARTGAGVRQEDEPGVEQHADAVRHGRGS
jgi:hypothetical protein